MHRANHVEGNEECASANALLESVHKIPQMVGKQRDVRFTRENHRKESE